MAVTDKRLIGVLLLVEALKSAEKWAACAELDEMGGKLMALRQDAEKAVRLIAQKVAEA